MRAGVPDGLYHPALAKALLVHTSAWGDREAELRRLLALNPSTARRDLTALLGYGGLRQERIGNAATNRAVLIAGGSIGREQRGTEAFEHVGSLVTAVSGTRTLFRSRCH